LNDVVSDVLNYAGNISNEVGDIFDHRRFKTDIGLLKEINKIKRQTCFWIFDSCSSYFSIKIIDVSY
jgi:hypothetical protein